MNTDNIQQKFVCDCGKIFDTRSKLSHHKTQCKIFKEKKKKKESEEREAKRLPNGMFICENPDCNKEHDGSYGSGKFCSKECKNHYNALTASKTAIKNGNKHAPKNFKKKAASYGTWKCNECGLIFRTRAELFEHNHLKYSERQMKNAWNKGLTKETSVSIMLASKKVSDAVRLAYDEGRLTGRCKDPNKEIARRKKISETAKKNGKAGGKRQKSGRGKQGWYKGYWCDSSWELAVILFWLDHNIPFSRYNGYFIYNFNGVDHKYYPDFIHPDGSFTEVKGAEKTAQWKAKIDQFPKDKVLHIIGKDQILPYLEYVISTYGKDFTNLYEKK